MAELPPPSPIPASPLAKYNVSFNASVTLPRHGTAGIVGDAPGIRFECSWNSVPDLSPSTSRRTLDGKSSPAQQQPQQHQFRLRATSIPQQPNQPPFGGVESVRPGWISLRKNSSSGYGSGEASPGYLAASLTVSSGPDATDKSLNIPADFDRRCRSTCSITLQSEAKSKAGSCPRPEGADDGGDEIGSCKSFSSRQHRRCSAEVWDARPSAGRPVRPPTAGAGASAGDKCAPFGDVKEDFMAGPKCQSSPPSRLSDRSKVNQHAAL